jgi:hypothetical protein
MKNKDSCKETTGRVMHYSNSVAYFSNEVIVFANAVTFVLFLLLADTHSSNEPVVLVLCTMWG